MSMYVYCWSEKVEGLGRRCFDVMVRDARGESMMFRVEDMDITFLQVRDVQSEEGLLKDASWKEAGPGVGKGGDGIAPSGRREFCSATHTSAEEEGMLVT